jgi:hypothetical protein
MHLAGFYKKSSKTVFDYKGMFMQNHNKSRLSLQTAKKRNTHKFSHDPQRNETSSIRLIAPNKNVRCCAGLAEGIALASLALTWYQVRIGRRLNRAQSKTKPRCPAISSFTKKRCNQPLIRMNQIDKNGEVYVETICYKNHKRTVPIIEAYNSTAVTLKVRKA